MSAENGVTQRSIVVGTAGHIDHGKTMLVRALTGVDTDRLPEEKRRGITIDLGFATCDMEGARGSRLSVDFIDVPGHKQFVRNMLAGAGGIDMVMLVIAANEGVMPQTEEHLAICSLLGIRRGFTVLTKADLVSAEELVAVRQRVRDALRKSFLEQAAIVAVSVVSGAGMGEIRKEIVALAEGIPERSSAGLPRLPLDRAFVMKGFGTVVTGTLQAGRLAAGQTLLLQPGGREVRVRGLQRHGQRAREALAGSRVALNLSGVEVGDVHRGETLVVPQSLDAADVIDAEISLLEGVPELRHRARVRLHSFTSDTVATVSVYGYRAVGAGQSAMVRLKLATPVVLVPGDRFVLRRLSPAQTVGGGRVLDAHPVARLPKKKALAWLERAKDASAGEQLELRVERRGAAGISAAQVAREMGLDTEAVRGLIAPKLANGAVRLLPHGTLVCGGALTKAGETLVGLMKASEGSAAANGGGIRRSELLSRSRMVAEVFDCVMEMLGREQRLRANGEFVYMQVAGAVAANPNQARMAEFAAVYERGALNPPALVDVMRQLNLSEKAAREIVTLLLREKTLVKIAAADIFMHRAAVDALEKTIRAMKQQTLDVGRLKQITGLSRKYAIPLLEHLDRQRITRRQGETRIVL